MVSRSSTTETTWHPRLPRRRQPARLYQWGSVIGGGRFSSALCVLPTQEAFEEPLWRERAMGGLVVEPQWRDYSPRDGRAAQRTPK